MSDRDCDFIFSAQIIIEFENSNDKYLFLILPSCNALPYILVLCTFVLRVYCASDCLWCNVSPIGTIELLIWEGALFRIWHWKVWFAMFGRYFVDPTMLCGKRTWREVLLTATWTISRWKAQEASACRVLLLRPKLRRKPRCPGLLISPFYPHSFLPRATFPPPSLLLLRMAYLCSQSVLSISLILQFFFRHKWTHSFAFPSI